MIEPAYARAHPEHTLSVGLLSTAAGRNEEDREKLRKLGEALEAKGVIETLPTLVARWFSDAFLANNPEAVQWRLDQVKRTPEGVFRSGFDIYATTEASDRRKRPPSRPEGGGRTDRVLTKGASEAGEGRCHPG